MPLLLLLHITRRGIPRHRLAVLLIIRCAWLLCVCRVVVVEEAGEILEAHVLTSLGPNTKHLVMIGKLQLHGQLSVCADSSCVRQTNYYQNLGDCLSICIILSLLSTRTACQILWYAPRCLSAVTDVLCTAYQSFGRKTLPVPCCACRRPQAAAAQG